MRELNTPKSGTVGLSVISDESGLRMAINNGTTIAGVMSFKIDAHHEGLAVVRITAYLHKLEIGT